MMIAGYGLNRGPCLLALLTMFAAASALAGNVEEAWSAWLAAQATPKIQEVTALATDGSVQSVVSTRQYDVRAKQVTVEEQKRGEDGILQVAKQTRTTEILDAFGGKLTIQEENVGLGGMLVPRQIVEEIKTPARTVTTVRTRNSDGHLVLTKRTTRALQEDGSFATEVEELNGSGALVVTERVAER
jgi:hypothetical protein